MAITIEQTGRIKISAYFLTYRPSLNTVLFQLFASLAVIIKQGKDLYTVLLMFGKIL